MQTSSASEPKLRIVLATLTLALVVLTCIGIQSVANRVTAQPHQATVAVQALAPAQTAGPVEEPGGFPVGVALVALVVLAGWKLTSRVRSVGSTYAFWDDMP